MSTDTRMDKEDIQEDKVVYMHLQQHGFNQRLSYWVKWGRKRQMPYDVTYMWNLKYNTNEIIYEPENRLTDIKSKLCFFYHGLLQDIAYSSLCSVGLSCLSVLYVVVYIC